LIRDATEYWSLFNILLKAFTINNVHIILWVGNKIITFSLHDICNLDESESCVLRNFRELSDGRNTDYKLQIDSLCKILGISATDSDSDSNSSYLTIVLGRRFQRIRALLLKR